MYIAARIQYMYISGSLLVSNSRCIWAASWQNQQCGCAPSEDSDQPGHPPSLIRVFACAQWEAKYPSLLHVHSEDSDQTGHTLILLVLSCRGSYVNNLLEWLICRATLAVSTGMYSYEPGHEKMCLMSYGNNKGADQPAHPRSLISAFVVRCLDSIISLDSIAEILRS